jgi:hypothetical protein
MPLTASKLPYDLRRPRTQMANSEFVAISSWQDD